MVGYVNDHDGYRVLVPELRKVLESHDVIFKTAEGPLDGRAVEPQKDGKAGVSGARQEDGEPAGGRGEQGETHVSLPGYPPKNKNLCRLLRRPDWLHLSPLCEFWKFLAPFLLNSARCSHTESPSPTPSILRYSAVFFASSSLVSGVLDCRATAVL